MANIDKKLFNGEMSDLVKATELLVSSVYQRVFFDQGADINIPYFVTLQRNDTKRKMTAWVSSAKVWHINNANGGKEELAYELNMATEFINRPLEETVMTICHELIHLYAIENGIKDTSRNGSFHNKEYKALCDKYNIKCEQDKKAGHVTNFPIAEQHEFIRLAYVYIKEDIKDVIDMFCLSEDWDINKEQKDSKPKKKQNAIKYSCQCGKSFRATSRMKVICAECFEKEHKPVYFLAEDEDVFIEKDVKQDDVPATSVETVETVDVDVPAKEDTVTPTEDVVANVPATEDKKAKSSKKATSKKSTTSRVRKSKTLPIEKAAEDVPSLKDMPILEESALSVNILGNNL